MEISSAHARFFHSHGLDFSRKPSGIIFIFVPTSRDSFCSHNVNKSDFTTKLGTITVGKFFTAYFADATEYQRSNQLYVSGKCSAATSCTVITVFLGWINGGTWAGINKTSGLP